MHSRLLRHHAWTATGTDGAVIPKSHLQGLEARLVAAGVEVPLVAKGTYLSTRTALVCREALQHVSRTLSSALRDTIEVMEG